MIDVNVMAVCIYLKLLLINHCSPYLHNVGTTQHAVDVTIVRKLDE
jgi:hypothetical protein